MFGARVDVQHGVEEGTDGEHHEQDGERQRDVAQHMSGGGAQVGHQIEPELDHQRRCDLRQSVKNLVVQTIIEPEQRRLTAKGLDDVQNDETHQTAKCERSDQQHQQTQGGA